MGRAESFKLCENGAKAVAFELAKRGVARDFFAAYTVRELEPQSDYWLAAGSADRADAL